MSIRQQNPAGPASREVIHAARVLAGAGKSRDPRRIAQARRKYWLAVAKDMRRKADLVEAAAKELEREEIARRRRTLEAELEQLQEVS
jgi:hypothetical protein